MNNNYKKYDYYSVSKSYINRYKYHHYVIIEWGKGVKIAINKAASIQYIILIIVIISNIL